MDEIKALEGQAAALDAEIIAANAPAPGAGAAVGPPPCDPLAEARDLIKFTVTLLSPLYPSIARIYTDATQERLAVVTGPLMAKYGLTLAGLFEKWGPEINFAIVALPLAMETAKGMRADLDAAKDAEARLTNKPADGNPEDKPL